MSYEMLTVQLAERSITLGPRESVEILSVEADSLDLEKHLRQGRLFIIPESDAPPAGGSPSAEAASNAKKDKPPKSNQ
jgi:hypothetical protein